METKSGHNAPPDEQRILAYFLDTLPVADRDRFEEEVFEDEARAELVLAYEEEMIEVYLRGGLTPEQRRRFVKHYLTTEGRRERVEMMQTLLAQVSAAPIEKDTKSVRWQPLWLSPSLAWGLLILLVGSGGMWWMLRSRDPVNIVQNVSPTPSITITVAPSVSPIVTPTRMPSVTPTARPSPSSDPPSKPVLATVITLSPGLSRAPGQALPTLALSKTATAAEVKLLLASRDFASYRVVLQTGNTAVWSRRKLSAQPDANGLFAVRVQIPTKHLQRADYQLLLFGETRKPAPSLDYSFRVKPQ